MTTSRWHSTGNRGAAARIVTGIGALFALIEVVYILFVILGANGANALVRFVRSLAEPLALFFPNLFPIANHNLNIVVNFGLAAVFWLVLSSLLARLVR